MDSTRVVSVFVFVFGAEWLEVEVEGGCGFLDAEKLRLQALSFHDCLWELSQTLYPKPLNSKL